MSYLTKYAGRRPSRVEEINLEFSVESAARENSLHKIETLIGALERFRAGLAAEAELRATPEDNHEHRKEVRECVT